LYHMEYSATSTYNSSIEVLLANPVICQLLEKEKITHRKRETNSLRERITHRENNS